MRLKQHLSLITFACLSATVLLGCQKDNKALTGVNDATITFNAGMGKWSNGTSITTLTVRKGYTWSFLKANIKDTEPERLNYNIIQGHGINLYTQIIHETGTNEIWHIGDNEEYISPDYVVNSNLVLNVDYDAAELSFQVVWDSYADPEPIHHYVEGHENERSAVDTSGKEGMTWGEVSEKYQPIAVSGYELEVFRFYKNSSGVVIDENYEIKQGDVLTAVYTYTGAGTFAGDSWTLFASIADTGFEKMSTLTHAQGGYKEEFAGNGNTFVGLERTVTIGGVNYPVRVIGEKVDNYSANKKATLTFEFVNAISQGRSYDTVDHNQNYYSDSGLSDYLNNKFFFTLPKDLQDVIRPVNKVTCLGLTSGTGQYRTSREAIFPLSLKELNFTETLPTGHAVELEGVGDSHSNCYQLYNRTSQIELEYYRTHYLLNKDGTRGNKVAYWVRSPDIDTSQYAWRVTENGKIDIKPTDVTEASGVACGFCIGAEDAGTAVTFNVSTDGGHWTGGSEEDRVVDLQDSSKRFSDALTALDATPQKDGGYTFAYWQDKDGHPIKNSRMIDASFTAYARFTDSSTYLLKSLNDKFEIDVAEFVGGQKVDVNISPLTYSDDSGNLYTVHDYPSSDQIILMQNGDYQLEEGYDYTYDQTSGTLNINENATYGSIDILINASQVVCGWSRIIEIAKFDEESDLGGTLASDVFNVGDYTYITINGVSHKVRIIDFGHDSIYGTSKTAAITFDFVTAASDSEKNLITTPFANTNVELADMKYEGNALNSAVTNFYNSIPASIRNNIKRVNKDTTYYEDSSLTKGSVGMYLFPLSLNEMNVPFSSAEISQVYASYDEGTPYAYYNECAYNTADIRLAKFDVNGAVVDSCYLRSGSYYVSTIQDDPYLNYNYTCAYLTKSDVTSMSVIVGNDAYTGEGTYHTMSRAFAPGFCI